MLHSAIYSGWVQHRRFAPRTHSFRYKLFMLYLDLDELDLLFKGRWLWSVGRWNLAWLRRADYLGDPTQPIRAAVQAVVLKETGHALSGPVRMLTHMRYFGHCFNPVTFYYCYAADGVTLDSIVAEITNTPWKERHAYVLDCRNKPVQQLDFSFSKDFHVSPFMPMQIEYDWHFGKPGQALYVHMRNLRGDGKMFDATLQLQHQPVTGPALAKVLLQFPLMTLKVSAAIYWQALRLWLKGVPFHSHPAKISKPGVSSSQGTRS